MDNELKEQIQLKSNRASRLSKEALSAFSARKFEEGKILMKEAVVASKECQKLLQQYTQVAKPRKSEKKA